MSNLEHKPQAAQPAKRHFEILDGLRGIAALGVVVFHFMEWIFTDPTQNFIGHGFLAVDFFFCLSGFVIAYAYNDRIEQMGKKAFFKARMIRLHPMVVMGTLLGLIGYFIDPYGVEQEVLSTGRLLLLVLCSLLMIPQPYMAERGNNLFGFNAPAWSLFWEYIANIVYAFVLYRIGRRVLWVCTAIAAAGIVWTGYKAGNLMGGWSNANFWDGGIRVAYSFLAGMLVYRSGFIIRNKLGFTGLTAMLALALMFPYFSINWLVEIVIVLFWFPLIVALGAGTTTTPSFHKIAVFSGKISYPLYMTHYAAIWIFGHYLTTQKPANGTLTLVVTIGTILLVVFAWIVMAGYDTPVREYLSRKKSR